MSAPLNPHHAVPRRRLGARRQRLAASRVPAQHEIPSCVPRVAELRAEIPERALFGNCLVADATRCVVGRVALRAFSQETGS